jgi:hypothetical protein
VPASRLLGRAFVALAALAATEPAAARHDPAAPGMHGGHGASASATLIPHSAFLTASRPGSPAGTGAHQPSCETS